MTDTETGEKLKHVLSTFLESNYRIADEMYLERLLSHFSGLNSSSSDAVSLQLYSQWINHLLDSWKVKPPEPSIAAFALQIMSVIVSDANRFNSLKRQDVMDKLVQMPKLRDSENTSVKLAYIAMLSALLKQEQGCDYIVKSGLWKDVVKYCLQDTSIYLTREGQKFITNFINVLFVEDSIVCDDVLKLALGPLMLKNSPRDNKEVIIEADCLDKDKLAPALEMASHICETSLSGTCNSVVCLMLTKFDLESMAWSLLNATEDIELSQKISKLLTLIYFTSLESKKVSNEVTLSDFKEFESKLYNLLSLLLTRGSLTQCIKVIVQCQFYWNKITVTVVYDEDKDNKQYLFENQLISLQLMPILCNIMTTTVSENDCLDTYCNKLFDLTYETTQRLAYSFRDFVIMQSNRPEVSHMAVRSILQIKDIMHRDRAVIVFQALMYLLKDFIPEMATPRSARNLPQVRNDFLIQFPELLSSVLEALTALIRCFRISWRESVETICLFSFMHLLLTNANLSKKLSVQTLQLMQEAIQNFMPPNLALLVNTLEGSSIGQLGPLLHKRMHDTGWEVRDSALEVLRAVTTIAEIKFTAFQEHVLENELCVLAVALAMDDAESYVRATALSCLCAMVKVERFWTECLSVHNLTGKMIKILRNETEGIVRREAAALMKEMYEHQKCPTSMLEEVFETMTAAAIGDLHWEVQVNSLDFWHKVIEHQMSNQGMIDGVFPSVTFSRQNRKIVTLTTNEIRTRLGKVLQELSRIGCLQVLLTSLEDCSLQVVNKAVDIVMSLSKLLSQYEIIPSREQQATNPLPDLISSNCIKVAHTSKETTRKPVMDTFGCENYKSPDYSSSSPAKKIARSANNGDVKPYMETSPAKDEDSQLRLRDSELVIKEIVQETDMRLLEQVYKSNMTVTDVKRDIKTEIVTPKDFLETLSKVNLTHLIEERTRWLDYYSDDLGSLLDDILASSVGRESIVIDCY